MLCFVQLPLVFISKSSAANSLEMSTSRGNGKLENALTRSIHI